MQDFVQALPLVFNFEVLLVIFAASAFGLIVGSIPGLTATMATALLIPVTFFMDPVPAIAAIVATVATAIFAGDIPGALLRMPGTPASAAYCEEAFALTRKGKAGLALGVGLTASVIGGLIGSVILVAATSSLAEFAFGFSSFEYFWVGCLGLSCAVVISSGSVIKGFTSLLLGLFISTIGIDLMSGHPRYTFGVTELLGGVSFIPALIGLFAISELLRYTTTSAHGVRRAPKESIGALFAEVPVTLRKYRVNLVRGSGIGAIIGVLPGAGADIAAWISYGVSKRFSKEPEKYGDGHVEGLVDASAANNSGLSGAWVPALVFGIPGDSITAIAIGVLYMKGLNPGPTIFQENAELLNAVFIIFFVANLVLLPLGLIAIRTSTLLLRVPQRVLMPVILLFCIVGSFAITNSIFGIAVMLLMGLIAYVMEENGFPIAPIVLGIVLGSMIEEMFLASMIKSDGNFLDFFSRPISAVLGIVTIVVWCIPIFRFFRKLRRMRSKVLPSGTLSE